jgi:ABC-type transport system involved in cytochrome c biogenesis permease subunit
MNWTEILPGLVLLHAVMATVAVLSGFLSRNERIKLAASGLLLAVFTIQTSQLIVMIVLRENAEIAQTDYIQILIWMLAALSLYVWRVKRLHSLGLILAPLNLVIALWAMLFGMEQALPVGKTPAGFFTIHIGCMFASLALVALGFCAAIIFLLQARILKAKAAISGFMQDFPSLSRLDSINKFTVSAGFIAYSLGIVFGMVSARLQWGMLLNYNPKEVLSLIIWALYAFLFQQRLAKGWQGKKPAIMIIVIFAACLFSLVIVNMFMTTHHGFAAGA